MKKVDIKEILIDKLKQENPDFNLKNSENLKSFLDELEETIFSLYTIRKEEINKNKIVYVPTYIRQYFVKISELSNGKKAELKKRLDIQNIHYLDGLYDIYYDTPEFQNVSKEKQELWSLCTRIYCFMNGSSKRSFASCLKDILISDSSKRNFEMFLNTNVTNKETFQKELLSFVHRVKSSGLLFDCCRLLYDVLNWDNESKKVQLSWAEDFYSNKN